MSDLELAVVLGSTRPGRNGKAVADWVMEQAAERSANYELIDLADHALPFIDEPIPPSVGMYSNEHTKAWSEVVARFDGFVFVTPEYNHSTSAVLKNALDYLYAEWNNKAAAFVGYGAAGALRAVEHLRSIASELQMAHVRQQVSFQIMQDFEEYRIFKPRPVHAPMAATMFDQLEAWAGALKPLRA